MTRLWLGIVAMPAALLAIGGLAVYQHARADSDCMHSALHHEADDPGRHLEDMPRAAADAYATVPKCVRIRVTDANNAVATVAFLYGKVCKAPINVPLERSSVGDGWLVMTTNRCED